MNEQTFLATILEQPDDDVVRLAYADWLMEQGDLLNSARGEFIQVQVHLARRTANTANASDLADIKRLPALKAREQELLAAHGKTWAKQISPLVAGYTFRRGFIEIIETPCVAFMGNAEILFDLAPIRRVKFRDAIAQGVADSQYLARLAELDFAKTYMGDAVLRRLLNSKYLTSLRWLDLSHCYITDSGLNDLAKSKLLSRLTHLDLGYNALTIEGVKALFSSPHWGQLSSLVLKGNYYIDSRQEQFLTQSLQGTPEPRLLRTLLQMTCREDREYTNVHVRDLANRASEAREQAAAVLAEGLGDGRRKVRSAAARMLAQLGPAGTAGLPRLVQRLFERSPLVRDQAAPALARLLNDLSPQMQRWLCVLANPLLSPQVNLRAVLDNPELPGVVREGFATICARREAWWTHIASGQQGPAPVPTGSPPTDIKSVRSAVGGLLESAANHAARHRSGGSLAERDRETGRTREAAWLLARLTELLQAALPKAEPVSAPATKSKRR